MQEESSGANKDWIVLNEVPGHYEVDGFQERYEVYLEEALQDAIAEQRSTDISCMVLMVLGGILCVVGFLAIIFGPSQVLVSRSGPNFLQFIQLYPGPIFSVGALVLWICNWLSSSPPDMSWKMPDTYLLRHWLMIMPDGTECDRTLRATYMDDNKFYIEYEYPNYSETSAG